MFLKFFVYSVLGCMLESVWCFLKTGRLKSKRMLIAIPMCPVYGAGGVLISAFLTGFRDNVVILFVLGSVLASGVEFLFFALGRLCFNIRLWDYSAKPYSFMDAVCGEYSLWWGLIAVIFTLYIDPAVTALLSQISPYTKLIITVFFALITFSDGVKTAKILKGFKNGNIDKLPDCFWYMKSFS